jgi:hypothetical protein
MPDRTNPELNTWITSLLYDSDIDERTCVPHWTSGDRMDWDLGIGHMFQIDEKAQRLADQQFIDSVVKQRIRTSNSARG